MGARKVGCFIAAVIMAFVGLGVAKWAKGKTSLYADVAATLPAEISAAGREGLPLAPADLMPAHPVQDASNAAPYYARLKPGSTGFADEQGVDAVLRGTATETDRVAARRLLAANAAQIRIAEQGAALPGCDFHRNWSLGLRLLSPNYGPMRSMARLLAAQALLESDAGHPEAALHTIAVGARMSHDVGQDPILIPTLVQIAMESILSRSFVRIMKRYADRPNVLALAADTDREFGQLPDIRHAAGWDVVLSRTIAETIRTTSPAEMRSEYHVPSSISREVMADVFEARDLSYWRRVFAAIDGARGDTMAAYRALKAVDDSEQAHITRRDPWLLLGAAIPGKTGETPKTDPNPTYEFSDMRFTDASAFATHLVDLDVRRRMRETFLMLLQYHNAHGAFPGSLALLHSEATLDPYIGQPLKYHLIDKGFTLYSVGVNLKDASGVGAIKQGEPPLDLILTYP